MEPEKKAPPAVPEPELKALQPNTARKVSVPVKPIKKPRKGKEAAHEGSVRKADLFTERVTLQISPEMRDDVDSLARNLQRAKTRKDERITANTVMRVAIQLLIDNYRFQTGDVVNSEQELFQLVGTQLGKQ